MRHSELEAIGAQPAVYPNPRVTPANMSRTFNSNFDRDSRSPRRSSNPHTALPIALPPAPRPHSVPANITRPLCRTLTDQLPTRYDSAVRDGTRLARSRTRTRTRTRSASERARRRRRRRQRGQQQSWRTRRRQRRRYGRTQRASSPAEHRGGTEERRALRSSRARDPRRQADEAAELVVMTRFSHGLLWLAWIWHTRE